MCQSLLFNKVAGLGLQIYFKRDSAKKETLARGFPVNFAKFLRTPFLQNPSGRLLLYSEPYQPSNI